MPHRHQAKGYAVMFTHEETGESLNGILERPVDEASDDELEFAFRTASPPRKEELLSKLCDLVRKNPRVVERSVNVAWQPGVFKLEIGGQAPMWEFNVDKSRLVPGELPAYAMEIVDKLWEAQLKTRHRPNAL